MPAGELNYWELCARDHLGVIEDHVVKLSVLILLPDMLDDFFDVSFPLDRVVVAHAESHELLRGECQNPWTAPVQFHCSDYRLNCSLRDALSCFVAHECYSQGELEAFCVARVICEMNLVHWKVHKLEGSSHSVFFYGHYFGLAIRIAGWVLVGAERFVQLCWVLYIDSCLDLRFRVFEV
jgi:hypothetical protein